MDHPSSDPGSHFLSSFAVVSFSFFCGWGTIKDHTLNWIIVFCLKNY